MATLDTKSRKLSEQSEFILRWKRERDYLDLKASEFGVRGRTLLDAAKGLNAYVKGRPRGKGRRLNDQQIAEIQRWWSERKATLGDSMLFKAKVPYARAAEVRAAIQEIREWRVRVKHIPSLDAIAREVGIHPEALMRVLARGPNYRHESFEMGHARRPALAYAPATLKRIFAWHRECMSALASSPPSAIRAEIAQRLNVSVGSVGEIIAGRRTYKEERAALRSKSGSKS